MSIANLAKFYLRLGLPIVLLFTSACQEVDSRLEDREVTASARSNSPDLTEIEPVPTEDIDRPKRQFPKVGNVVSESRNVSNFDRVRCSFGKLIVTQGDRESLTVIAEDRLLDRIVSEVRDGTLYLYPKSNEPFVTFDRVQFQLTVKNLNALNLDGVVQVKAEQLKTDRLQLGATGSAKIDIESLDADTLQVDLGGASELSLAGKVTDQTLTFSGGSRYYADLLESQTVALEINGAGKAAVWANDRLDVQINGAGTVNFYGNPDVRQQIRGVGSIQPIGGFR
ncbi:MAG TPA: DUF2807 domain-containing protein [Oscillatoriales cyanobacterium M59_W2019_021]|nr:MAG: DUF2807 domain-containing protein [Cyanobacteria bacterium J055]HIK31276.1 DUF2807 domain-containing protein [Oscillatoriales cyanobacterium M4454_W2019_049]HIK51866.1 DUF2807 domain-containing protein [Oscillatoriales cyanobacterium M59_W2019_021]